MNTIKNHMVARPLGVIMALLMMLTSSYLTFGLSTNAKAQDATGNPRWAVLDFNNNTGYGGSEIGRQAADALDVELFNANKTEVIKRSEISDAVDQLGLQYPLDVIDIEKLGRYLDARAVVSGEVLSISRNDDHQVQATVAVRVTDVSSGELINGALAQGTSVARPDSTDDDAQVNEAIRKAAFAAVQRMEHFNLPIATVLANEGADSVLLNKGSRDGYFLGMNMLVLRNGEETGRLRIASIDQDTAIASVTNEGIGIRPQDRAHVLYSMPSYRVSGNKVYTTGLDTVASGSAPLAAKQGNFSGAGGIVLAILAGALLLSLVNRGINSDDLAGGQVGSVVAQAAINFAGGGNTLDDEGVRVSWSAGNINPRDIIGFNVYRDNYEPNSSTGAITSGSTAGTTTTTTSTTTGVTQLGQGPVDTFGPTARFGYDTCAPRTITYPFSEVIQTTTTTSGTTSTGTTTTTGTTGTTGSTGSTGSTGGTTTGGTTGTTTSSGVNIGQLAYATDSPIGAAISATHNYEVTAVWQVRDEATGLTGAEETSVSTGGASGFATPLPALTPSNITIENPNDAPVVPYGNGAAIDTTNVQFFISQILGANEYVIDIATTNTFTNKQSFVIEGDGISGQVVKSPIENIAALFSNAAGPYFYRIGARNNVDIPGPYVSGTVPNSTPNGSGGSYIYPASPETFTSNGVTSAARRAIRATLNDGSGLHRNGR